MSNLKRIHYPAVTTVYAVAKQPLRQTQGLPDSPPKEPGSIHWWDLSRSTLEVCSLKNMSGGQWLMQVVISTDIIRCL